MAIRCPECNKYVSVEPGDADLNGDLSLEADGSLTGEATLTLCCTECGEDLLQGTFDFLADNLTFPPGTKPEDCNAVQNGDLDINEEPSGKTVIFSLTLSYVITRDDDTKVLEGDVQSNELTRAEFDSLV